LSTYVYWWIRQAIERVRQIENQALRRLRADKRLRPALFDLAA